MESIRHLTCRGTVALLIAHPRIMVYSVLALLWTGHGPCDDARAVFPLRNLVSGFRCGPQRRDLCGLSFRITNGFDR